MKRAVVIGSGAGGATAAKELQGKFDVTVLEEGKPFVPMSVNLQSIYKLKKTGLMLDERMAGLIFPPMRIRKTAEDMVLVNGRGLGGTTTICTGNALREDDALKAIGINLDEEFDELADEVPISTDHQKRWHPNTRKVYEICEKMGLQAEPTPKMAFQEKCAACGRCIFGCLRGAKWDSRYFLDDAVARGARLVSNCKVERLILRDGHASGVEASNGWHRRFIPADLVIVAAGGLGTPGILRNSGLECVDRLFVDPVLCVAARWDDSRQDTEIPMPFVVQRENFIISPYFDFLSYFFNGRWKYPAKNIYSIMIKIADTNCGGVQGRRVDKTLSVEDRRVLDEGTELCTEILHRVGINDGDIFLGTLNAGHPGGMLPLTENESRTFHHRALPENVYVCDSTLFPESLGNPPILTIMAMAKRIGKICRALA